MEEMDCVDAGRSTEDDQLLEATIKVKIDVFMLKQKKRLLLEELYRRFYDGEKEPKKRTKQIRQEDSIAIDHIYTKDVDGSSISIVTKNGRK
jgi:hypothetical protein